MVVEVDEGQRSIELSDRTSKLVQTTRKTLPRFTIASTGESIIVINGTKSPSNGHSIQVHLVARNFPIRVIEVYHDNLYNSGMKLARAYEATGEDEFSVFKKYA